MSKINSTHFNNSLSSFPLRPKKKKSLICWENTNFNKQVQFFSLRTNIIFKIHVSFQYPQFISGLDKPYTKCELQMLVWQTMFRVNPLGNFIKHQTCIQKNSIQQWKAPKPSNPHNPEAFSTNQTHKTQNKKKPIWQNLTYLLKIVSFELISDSDRSEDSDSQKREWQRESEEVAIRAGTRTCHHR